MLFFSLHESFKSALKAIWKNKLRSILTTLGIVIGITTIIVVVSLLDGLKASVLEQFQHLGTGVLHVSKYPWVRHGKWYKYRRRKSIGEEELEAIKTRCPSAKYISPVEDTHEDVKFQTLELNGIEIVGATPDYPYLGGANLKEGRYFTGYEENRKKMVCILGKEIHNKLKEKKEPLGKWITIGGYKFKVLGIQEKQGGLFGESPDDKIIIPFSVMRKYFDRWGSIDIQIAGASGTKVEKVKDEVTIAMRQVRSVGPGEDNDFSINQQEMLIERFENITNYLYIAMIAIAGISLIVGGVGIMNIMLISVTERTKEIGIRKAIGAKKKQILGQFLVEALIICWLGGVIGTATGFSLGGFVSLVSPLPAKISMKAALWGFLFASSVALFFGLYPAFKAANLDPIESLHYE